MCGAGQGGEGPLRSPGRVPGHGALGLALPAWPRPRVEVGAGESEQGVGRGGGPEILQESDAS